MKIEVYNTYIRVLKNMPIVFSNLYNEEFSHNTMDLPKEIFNKLEPNKLKYKNFKIEQYFDRIATVAKIQINLISIYQNKDAITEACLSKNEKFNQSFHDIILSKNLEKQKELCVFLDTIRFTK